MAPAIDDEEIPAIVCPTRFEAKVILHAKLVPRRLVLTSGPGPDAVRSLVKRIAEDSWRPLILVGVAGALSSEAPLGAGFVASPVIDAHGARFEPTLKLRGASAAVVSVERVVTTPAAKRELGERTRAALVDLESAAFASAADRAKRRWAVIRAVSDGAEDAVPEWAEGLLDPQGAAKVLRALGMLALHPHRLDPLIELGTRAMKAMAEATAVLRDNLEDGRVRR